jgi:hypothetical protein
MDAFGFLKVDLFPILLYIRQINIVTGFLPGRKGVEL